MSLVFWVMIVEDSLNKSKAKSFLELSKARRNRTTIWHRKMNAEETEPTQWQYVEFKLGVFAMSAQAGLASGPGYGQPRPGANWSCLVAGHVELSLSSVEIVFVCQPKKDR